MRPLVSRRRRWNRECWRYFESQSRETRTGDFKAIFRIENLIVEKVAKRVVKPADQLDHAPPDEHRTRRWDVRVVAQQVCGVVHGEKTVPAGHMEAFFAVAPSIIGIAGPAMPQERGSIDHPDFRARSEERHPSFQSRLKEDVVSVHDSDKLAPSVTEGEVAGSAAAAILVFRVFEVEDSLRIHLGETPGDLRTPVGRSVVDQKELPAVERLPERSRSPRRESGTVQEAGQDGNGGERRPSRSTPAEPDGQAEVDPTGPSPRFRNEGAIRGVRRVFVPGLAVHAAIRPASPEALGPKDRSNRRGKPTPEPDAPLPA